MNRTWRKQDHSVAAAALLVFEGLDGQYSQILDHVGLEHPYLGPLVRKDKRPLP